MKIGGRASHLKLISENTTFSIPADTETVTLKFSDGSTYDLDVKDRARGVPEWVKDGAWVVNVVNGELRKVIAKECGKFDLTVNDLVSIRYHNGLQEHYRPFTNSDWKWGMWAEYKGEKVFVSAILDAGIGASNKNNGYFFIPFDKITPTAAP